MDIRFVVKKLSIETYCYMKHVSTNINAYCMTTFIYLYVFTIDAFYLAICVLYAYYITKILNTLSIYFCFD